MTPEEYNKLTEGQKAVQLRIARAGKMLNRISELKKVIQALSNPMELHETSAGKLTLYGRPGMAIHRDDAIHFRHVLESVILPRLEAEYESI